MAVSLRYRGNLKKLHLLLEETAIENQPTVRMPTVRGPETDQLPPLAFYRIKERYAVMQIAKAVARFVTEHACPPVRIGLSYEMAARYWRVLHMAVYYYHRPDGTRHTVLLSVLDIPETIIYCSAKRS